eukprot:COSAG02_NODE_10461_length_1937_cov_1.322089_1_plen_479_part_00
MPLVTWWFIRVSCNSDYGDAAKKGIQLPTGTSSTKVMLRESGRRCGVHARACMPAPARGLRVRLAPERGLRVRPANAMEAAAMLVIERAELLDELQAHLTQHSPHTAPAAQADELAGAASCGTTNHEMPTAVESVRLRLRLHRLNVENETADVALAGGRRRLAEHPAYEPEVLRRAKQLLRPGAIFRGQICIPGLSRADDEHDLAQPEEDSPPSDYTLEVVGAVVDGLGNSFLLAHHEAYEDKQACYIDLRMEGSNTEGADEPAERLEPQAPQVSLRYSDAETLCSGHIALPNPSSDEADKAAISGTVKQLAYGEDGFLLPSAITHTFELVSAAPDGVIDLRAALHLARQQLICALASYLSLQENSEDPLEDPMHQEDSALRALLTQSRAGDNGWSGWFRIATLMAEDCAAWLRHAAVTLDALSFETSGEKTAVLGALVRAEDPSFSVDRLLTCFSNGCGDRRAICGSRSLSELPRPH